jgi:hypothetical protein
MADNSTKPDGFSFLASIIAVLITIAVFAVIVFWTYGTAANEEPHAVATASDKPVPPTGAELKVHENEVLSSYGWVDQDKGVVRIPVDVAQNLVIQELNK